MNNIFGIDEQRCRLEAQDFLHLYETMAYRPKPCFASHAKRMDLDSLLAQPEGIHFAGGLHSMDGEIDLDYMGEIKNFLGMSDWILSMNVAALAHDHIISDEGKRYLEDMVNCLQEYGMPAWLVTLLNDAHISCITNRFAQYQPPLYQNAYQNIAHPIEECMVEVPESFPTSNEGFEDCLKEDVKERIRNQHLDDCYAHAAYNLLLWTDGTRLSNQAALTLLTYPHYGCCILREDEGCARKFGVVDNNYRLVVDYLNDLRNEADEAYKSNPEGGLFESGHDGTPSLLKNAAARFQYDARHLIKAYRSFWNSETPTSQHMLVQLESDHIKPEVDIWENPVYLNDLAMSLLGRHGAKDLIEGFEQRKDAQFKVGVRNLKSMMKMVETNGLLLTPCAVIMGTMMETQKDMSSLDSFEKDRECAADFGHCIEDMAVVILSRVWVDEEIRNFLGFSLMNGNLTAYSKAALMMMDPDGTSGYGNDLDFDCVDE